MTGAADDRCRRRAIPERRQAVATRGAFEIALALESASQPVLGVGPIQSRQQPAERPDGALHVTPRERQPRAQVLGVRILGVGLLEPRQLGLGRKQAIRIDQGLGQVHPEHRDLREALDGALEHLGRALGPVPLRVEARQQKAGTR